MHGSDAHREEKVGEPEQERLCWLKGDLTFETLRQAVVEPAERVWIGAHPPSYATPAYAIKLRYGIEYDRVAIEQLSPGTRGVVLLLLYVAVDLYDQRPLILDQPEENLDPNSVFEELVPHVRAARTRRQVIIVTHNANLVVNTDADQVIIASSMQKPGGLPEIDCESGSLENPTIRGAVCQILRAANEPSSSASVDIGCGGDIVSSRNPKSTNCPLRLRPRCEFRRIVKAPQGRRREIVDRKVAPK